MAAIIQGLNKFVQDKVSPWDHAHTSCRDFHPDLTQGDGRKVSGRESISSTTTRITFGRQLPICGSLQRLALVGSFGDTNQLIAEGRSVEKVILRGAEPQYTDAIPLFSVERGRFVSAFDEEHARSVVVLGAALSESLFPYTDAVGKTVESMAIHTK